MSCRRTFPLIIIAGAATAAAVPNPRSSDGAQAAPGVHILSLPLNSLTGLDVRDFNEDDAKPLRTQIVVTRYRGRPSVHVSTLGNGQALALIKNSDFEDGTIEADIAATPGEDAPPDARGFVGISFHVQEQGARYETVYLRMTNGRADDQLRRNHSAQYMAMPEFPWYRLRKETAGVYESYVDLDPGAWTHIKVEVTGVKAALYVNGARQPCLIVNDLKLGATAGAVALWSSYDTEAYFSNFSIH